MIAGVQGAEVVSVSRDPGHHFSKVPVDQIQLRAGHGVEGDAHAGATVRHRSRVAADPSQPNLRQVHLLHVGFLTEARSHGYDVLPGDLGENVLTDGIDLLQLPKDTELRLGPDAVVRITGLRNPCWQIDRFRKGLLRLAVERSPEGEVIRKAGVMSVVTASGSVAAGDRISVVLPPPPHRRLDRV
jgi:MOSC domain-containing protein YiiM